MATVTLLVAQAVDSSLVSSHSNWLEMSHSVFEEMIRDGNLLAEFRKNETEKLKQLLDEFLLERQEPSAGRLYAGADIQTRRRRATNESYLDANNVITEVSHGIEIFYNEYDLRAFDLNAQQVFAAANSLGVNSRWLSVLPDN